jgi:ABC-type amino acid transport substrate-binding protein
MKNQYAGHIVIFLVAILFAYIYSISPSLTKAKAKVTEQLTLKDRLLVRTKVCASFWFDDDSRDNRELKDLFRTTLGKFIQDKTPSSWLVESINLDSETLIKEDYQADGRCQDISVKLIKGQGETTDLFQDKSVLRIGVRDKQGIVSQFNPNTKEWRGVAVDFGRLIAKKMGKKAVFTRLKSLESRFTVLRYGVADLTISLITKTAKRAEIAYLSDTYYTTGLVLGTFANKGEEQMYSSRVELNSNSQTLVAVNGSSGVDFIRKNYPKSNIVTTTTSAEIPGHVHELMSDPTRGDIFFITDELIASRWQDSHVVYVDGKRLLTNNDSYVVAMGDKSLLATVNKVIASGEVKAIYVR